MRTYETTQDTVQFKLQTVLLYNEFVFSLFVICYSKFHRIFTITSLQTVCDILQTVHQLSDCPGVPATAIFAIYLYLSSLLQEPMDRLKQIFMLYIFCKAPH